MLSSSSTGNPCGAGGQPRYVGLRVLGVLFAGLTAGSGCGGGGGAATEPPPPPPPVVLRPEVKQETLMDITGRDAYKGEAGVGYAHVCPGADDRQGPRSFLLVVSGFAPDRIDAQPLDGELESSCATHDTNVNYHRVGSRWINGADYIQRNAGVIRQLIELMTSRYEIDGDDRFAVVGYSMGGLVSRYALQTMESEGVSNNVDLFVSVDAPQQGAYVPIGVQHIVKLFKDYGARPMLNEIDSPAAKQMLIYHYRQGSREQTWTDDYKALYFDELDGMLGGFLHDESIRTVGVSSGRTGGELNRPRPGEVFYTGTLDRSETETYEHKIDQAPCKMTLEFDVKIDVHITPTVRSLGLRPTQFLPPYSIIYPNHVIVATSQASTEIDGIDIDNEDALVKHFKSLTKAQTSFFCDFFVTDKNVRGIVKDIVEDNDDEIEQFDNKSYLVPPDGVLTEGAPGGLSHVIGDLKTRLADNGFRLGNIDAAIRNQKENVFIPFNSALMLSGINPLRSYDHATLAAASAFDSIYYEQSENLYHLESNSVWFEKEVLALFDVQR
ncbi:MAG TPA: hypothetical protein PKK10_12995 [Woeseiaceae bacterium]|nr:hypothetical protein [Woeseiaceae bacterium]